jgi:hypothetical protein
VVSPPPDVGSRAGAAAAAPNPSSAAPPGPSGAERGAALPDGPAAVDRADIRPLDLPAALQILIAEVRAALIEALATDFQPSAGPADAAAAAASAAQDLDGPAAAARVIVDLVLRSLPETFEPDSWSVALLRVDLAVQTGVQRAIDAVSVWRDVPAAVVVATEESGSLALELIADEPIYPWPSPEWLGMAPRLGRLWRRRRFLKRRLADPDYAANSNWDHLNDPRP